MDKTLYFHSASLHPGVKIGRGDFDAGGSPAMVLQIFCGEHYNILALKVFQESLLRSIPFLYSFQLFSYTRSHKLFNLEIFSQNE